MFMGTYENNPAIDCLSWFSSDAGADMKLMW